MKPMVSLFALCLSLPVWVFAAANPNFIIVFTDDQGYADLGSYGSGSAPAGAPWKSWDGIPIRTPRLDSMAAQGVRFTSFYSGYVKCTQSRMALLTGSYVQRTGYTSTQVIFPEDDSGLNPNEITIADLLKGRGYATAAIGKWHIGHKGSMSPNGQGFDYYYGIPYSNDMYLTKGMKLADGIVLKEGWTLDKLKTLMNKSQADIKAATKNRVPLLRNDEIVEFPADQALVTRGYTDEAVKFVAANKDKPFFLYLAHSMPHIPLYASVQFKDKSPRGLYGDVIEELDWNIGRLLDTLKVLGIDSSTLVFFSSDNGPWLDKGVNGGTAYPLRDGKMSNWEGGMRVPGIFRWPGKIPGGKVQDEIASVIDVFPTFAGLTGGNLPAGRVIDGKSIWPLLDGTPGAVTPHQAFYYDLGAVRQGEWKLRSGKLYNLKTDIHEDTDVSAANPEIKAALQKLLDDFSKDLLANKREAGNATTKALAMGCTEVGAANYDKAAEIDDGSCRETSALNPPKQASNQIFIHGGYLNILSPGRFSVKVYGISGNTIFSQEGGGDRRYPLADMAGTGIKFISLRNASGYQTIKYVE